MTDEPIRPGEVLAGKYRVERVLGQGGMGVVVAATHLRLDELVAIKLLLPDIAQSQETVERFAREARAASKIKSEHVARVTDVDTRPDGSTYMVMEYLEGSDLGAHVRPGEPLEVEEAVGYLLQVCEAMAEAHSLGIIHRDLKPENLFLARRRDGSTLVKVLDFGISKVVDPSSSQQGLTHTRGIVGSPHFMSPEQLLASRTVDVRTDIWALGVTLYQLVTGTLPFSGDTLPETCSLVMHAVPERPRAIRPDLPEGLEAVILRCLEKDREGRFASMGELAAALAEFGPPEAQVWVERAIALSGAPSERMSSPRLSRASLATGTPRTRVRPEGAAQAARASAETVEIGAGPTLNATAVTQGAPSSRRRVLTALGIAAAGAAAVVVLLSLGRSAPLPAPGAAAVTTAAEERHAPPTPPLPSAVPLVTPASGEPVAPSSASAPPASASAPPAASAAPARSRPPQRPPSKPGAVPAATEDTIGF